jgi:hypothetical protein
VIDKIANWDKLLCRDQDGNIHSLLTSWTDYPVDEPTNPFIGTVDFWFNDLQMLARLIDNIKKNV